MANAYGKTHFLREAKALASYEPLMGAVRHLASIEFL